MVFAKFAHTTLHRSLKGKTQELIRVSVVAKNATTETDGKKYEWNNFHFGNSSNISHHKN